MARRGAAGFSPERFRVACASAGISSARLATASHTSPAAISKYLAGLASPEPPRLALLAAALGVQVTNLLDPAPEPTLAWLRAAAGFTQRELAVRAGIHLKRYEAAEAGRRELQVADATRLAGVLSLPVAEVTAAASRK